MGQLWASKQERTRLSYGFTDLRGKPAGGGGRDAQPEIKTSPAKPKVKRPVFTARLETLVVLMVGTLEKRRGPRAPEWGVHEESGDARRRGGRGAERERGNRVGMAVFDSLRLYDAPLGP